MSPSRRNRRKWQVFGFLLALAAVSGLALAIRGTEWVSLIAQLWRLAFCILGGMSLLIGVLLKRGALQQGPWPQQYAGAQICLGMGTLLAIGPGFLVAAGKAALLSYGAVQWAWLSSLVLFILSIALWNRARKSTRPSGKGIAGV